MKKQWGYRLAIGLLWAALTGCSSSPNLIKEGEAISRHYGFEESLEDFEGRGKAKVERTDQEAKEGKSSVYVSARTAKWHGLSKDMTKNLEGGKTYTIGAWVKYNEGAIKESMNIVLQQTLTSTKGTKNITVAEQEEVKKGEWTYLEGQVTLAKDLSALKLFVEAKTPELSFFVDELSIKASEPPAETPTPVEKKAPVQMVNKAVQQDIPSLKEVYKDYFKVGTAISTQNMAAIDKEAILKHFNSLTCGNELKPENVLDYNGTIAYMNDHNGDQIHPQVHFKAAHSILTFCGENHIPMRGHVLVWHSQTPNWFFKENYSKDVSAPNVSKEVMLQRLENYIKMVFETLQEQYPDVEFYAWDVVNEAIDPGTENGLRLPAEVAKTTGDDNNQENQGKSMWMATVGEEFIEKAFEYARKYAPEGVKLTYNDYNECEPKKTEIMYNLCKKLKAQGNLDIIGMQGHYDMNGPKLSDFEAAVRKYASLGVEIQLTEIDIMQKDASPEGMLKQGYRYQELFDRIKKLSQEPDIHIGACVFWGTDDGHSWRRQKNPLLFDANYQAKPAYWGIVDPTKLAEIEQELKLAQ